MLVWLGPEVDVAKESRARAVTQACKKRDSAQPYADDLIEDHLPFVECELEDSGELGVEEYAIAGLCAVAEICPRDWLNGLCVVQ